MRTTLTLHLTSTQTTHLKWHLYGIWGIYGIQSLTKTLKRKFSLLVNPEVVIAAEVMFMQLVTIISSRYFVSV